MTDLSSRQWRRITAARLLAGICWSAAPPAIGFGFRIREEAKTLLRELPGYAKRCKRARYRLIPGVW